MTDIATYTDPSAPEYRRWIAYIVLDDGKLWGVYAIGATEAEAETKIDTLWRKERAKHKIQQDSVAPVVQQEKQHHFAGLIWLINKNTREKKRVTPEVAEGLTAFGEWERGGPRSK